MTTTRGLGQQDKTRLEMVCLELDAKNPTFFAFLCHHKRLVALYASCTSIESLLALWMRHTQTTSSLPAWIAQLSSCFSPRLSCACLKTIFFQHTSWVCWNAIVKLFVPSLRTAFELNESAMHWRIETSHPRSVFQAVFDEIVKEYAKQIVCASFSTRQHKQPSTLLMEKTLSSSKTSESVPPSGLSPPCLRPFLEFLSSFLREFVTLEGACNRFLCSSAWQIALEVVDLIQEEKIGNLVSYTCEKVLVELAKKEFCTHYT